MFNITAAAERAGDGRLGRLRGAGAGALPAAAASRPGRPLTRHAPARPAARSADAHLNRTIRRAYQSISGALAAAGAAAAPRPGRPRARRRQAAPCEGRSDRGQGHRHRLRGRRHRDRGAATSSFTITNAGTKVTEFYVYAAGDRVMGEVENIVPGLSRELIVELTAGTYETACKPGHDRQGHPRRAEGHRRAPRASRPTPRSPRPPPATSGTSTARPPRCWPRPRSSSTRSRPATSRRPRRSSRSPAPTASGSSRSRRVFGDLDPTIDGREDDSSRGHGVHRLPPAGEGPLGHRRRQPGRPDRRPADGRRQGDRGQGQRRSSSPRCSSPTAPRVCSTRWPAARSPARRTATRTPTCGTSTPTCEGSKAAVAALRPVAGGACPRAGQARSTPSSPTPRPRSASTGQGDGWKLHTELTKAELKELSDASTRWPSRSARSPQWWHGNDRAAVRR